MAEGAIERQYKVVKLFDPPDQPERREICSSLHRVTVHHPGYESTRLLEISAFDGEAGGIHHGTLRLLCGIIAGGVWDGWLSEEKDGAPVTAGLEDVLTKHDYFYHRPKPANDLSTTSTHYKYAVVLSLDDLTFPHENPPPGWTFVDPNMSSLLYSGASASSMSQAVRDRDERCRLTGEGDGIERAHLCPRAAASYFTREELERYNMSTTLSGATSVDDMANAIALRKDVHAQLDKGVFVFVRKHGKWVPHFLDPTKDLGPKYHNVPIEMPAIISEAFILVNVAKTLLPRMLNFLLRGEKRRVIVKRGGEPQQIKEMSGTREIRHCFCDVRIGSLDKTNFEAISILSWKSSPGTKHRQLEPSRYLGHF